MAVMTVRGSSDEERVQLGSLLSEIGQAAHVPLRGDVRERPRVARPEADPPRRHRKDRDEGHHAEHLGEPGRT